MASNNNGWALITGGTSGIGLELAKLFADKGYNLVIVARAQQELDKTAEEISKLYGVEVQSISKDLFEPNGPFEVYDEVKARGIQVDVLVNDAGQGQYGLFVETDIHRELQIIQLNIAAYLILTKQFLKEMVGRKNGKILQVASIAGKLPGPYQSVYHATKAFILSHTMALVNELKDTGVTITALLPGATDTDFFHKAEMEDAKMIREDKDSLADPADVAKDGFEALMNGESKVVSGFKNKLQTTLSNVMPDSLVSAQMAKQMEPSSEESK
ncbi:MAG: SDR family oxidoreductase [Williamsia sp.]|nr:SDR family oxidoreductase [Williamsia sp.]